MQTHESLDRQHDVAASSERSFGLVFAGFFAIVAGFRMWHGHSDSAWWLGAGTAFAIAALLRPAVLAPLNRAWARVGRLLHAIANPVLMGLIFAVAIVPTGLALRLLGKDLLRLRRDPSAATYWVDRHGSATHPGSMKDQF